MLQGSFLPTVFQNFEARTNSKDVAPRVAALRKELAALQATPKKKAAS